MKRLNFCGLFGTVLSLLYVLPCGADRSDFASMDQNTAVLMDRVMRSEEGQGIKPVTVVYVIPYVHPASLPPLEAHKRIFMNKLYFITSKNMFYSFLLTPTFVHLQWQARLVPQNDKTAMHPLGSLGFLLLKQYKSVPNSVSGGERADGGAFLRDIELRQPLVIYHIAKGKLVHDGEQYY